MTRKNNLEDSVATIKELSECAKETHDLMKGFTQEVKLTKDLWKEHNKSWLIKAGIILLAFPEPFISDIVGSGLIAAGLLKAKMQSSTLYMEDVGKTFARVFKSVEAAREKVR